MKRLWFALAVLFWSVPALGQPSVSLYCWNPTGSSFTQFTPCNSTNPLIVSATITPSGTQNVNITQVLGAAVSATNPLFVSPATASTPWAVTGSGTAGTAAAGVVTVQGIASMTPLLATVTNAGTFAVQPNGAYAVLGITPTDRTVTSATGASQTVMASNASRHSLIVQNTGNANCGVNPTGGTAVIGGAATLTLTPGGSYQPRTPTLSAVTAICTSGQPLYAEEN